MVFNKIKQRYKISTSFIKPILGPHVLLIRVSMHAIECKWGIGYVLFF